jgi:hypothetical protein
MFCSEYGIAGPLRFPALVTAAVLATPDPFDNDFSRLHNFKHQRRSRADACYQDPYKTVTKL